MLTDTLRDLDDDRLMELFRSRPDLLNPLPADLGQLASRATTKASLARALDRLDRFQIAVLEAVAIAESPVSEGRVRELLTGPAGSESAARGSTAREPAKPDSVDAALRRLRAMALLWGPEDDLALPSEAVALLGPYPAGLGPAGTRSTSAGTTGTRSSERTDPVTPTDPEGVRAALTDAGPQARALAERLAAGPPVGRFGGRSDPNAQAVVDAMVDRGLLVRVDSGTVALPREVGLALRGGRLLPESQCVEPPLDGTVRDASLTDRAAAGTAVEVVRQVEQLLDEFGREPPARLKAGGLGVRELKKVATQLDTAETTTALLLQVACASGLLAADTPTGPDATHTERGSARWLPTVEYDRWLQRDPARRWADLVRGWLYDTHVAGLVGTRDERDRARTALSTELARPAAPEIRALVVRTLARAQPGTGIEPDVMLAHLRWHRPRRANAFFDDFVRWTLAEAATLGLTGLGALGAAGRVLAESEEKAEEVADALRPLLPEPVDHVLLQADLTAVAPGPLIPEVARTLAGMADAESHGGATVYRFSADSIRRALDAGRTAAELHDTLAELSRTPVPQPLTYLVEDSARRHGRLRAGAAAAYLRCDDVTTLDAMMADRRAEDLGLRRLAPTVVISPVPAIELVTELRALGYEPVTEGSDGALLTAGPDTERTTAGSAAGPPREERGPDPTMVQAAVRALRAGERARSARPEPGSSTLGRTASMDAVRMLRTAIDEGWTVWVGYADQHGGTTERVLDPIQVNAGAVTAYDHAAGVTRRFQLHRITGVARLQDESG